jgi:hypothetical protein
LPLRGKFVPTFTNTLQQSTATEGPLKLEDLALLSKLSRKPAKTVPRGALLPSLAHLRSVWHFYSVEIDNGAIAVLGAIRKDW